MTAVLIVSVAAAIFVGLLAAFGLAEYERGKAVAVATEREREAEIARKQAEIIAEHRTPEDAAKALDSGKF